MDTLSKILDIFDIQPQTLEGGRIDLPEIDRDGLAVLFAQLGFTQGAEIGTEQGVYAEILCKANPELKLYCIDAWKAYRGYRDHTSQEKLDRFYNISTERLGKYNCVLVRKFSEEAVREFADNSLDFVYIDGNHSFYHTTFDIHHWLKKIKHGGIIAGHDYTKYKNGEADIHVYEVVNAFTQAYHIAPWFVVGKENRSWFWVKP